VAGGVSWAATVTDAARMKITASWRKLLRILTIDVIPVTFLKTE
jgi:hypothetical protein